MATDQQRLSNVERANLVAYLDGELNEAETNALSAKLTQSVTARREIDLLEKTWELLDHLPRPQAPPEFVSRTLSEVDHFEAQGGALVHLAGRSGRIALRVAVCLLVSAVTMGLGYATTRWLWPDPTARLARDLSIAEHFDEYMEVRNFELLQQLDQIPALNEDTY